MVTLYRNGGNLAGFHHSSRNGSRFQLVIAQPPKAASTAGSLSFSELWQTCFNPVGSYLGCYVRLNRLGVSRERSLAITNWGQELNRSSLPRSIGAGRENGRHRELRKNQGPRNNADHEHFGKLSVRFFAVYSHRDAPKLLGYLN